MYFYLRSSESVPNVAYHVSNAEIDKPDVNKLSNPRNLGVHLIKNHTDVEKFIASRDYKVPVYVYKAELQNISKISSYDLGDWLGMELARHISESEVLSLQDASYKLRELKAEFSDDLTKLAKSIRAWFVNDLNVNCIEYDNEVEFNGPCLCVLDNSCFKLWELVKTVNPNSKDRSQKDSQ